MPLNSDIHDQSLGILDLWLVIKEKWKLFLGVWMATTAISISLYALQAPVFESKTLYSVGTITNEYIEDPKMLVERLRYKHKVNDAAFKGLPRIIAIESLGTTNNVFVAKSLGASPDKAQLFLKRMVYEVLEEHESLFEKRSLALRERLDQLDAELVKLTKMLQGLDDQIEIHSENNASLAAIVHMKRTHIYSQMARLRETIFQLQRSLTPPETKRSKIIIEPTFEKGAVGAGLLMYAFVGIVTGFVLSIFAMLLAMIIRQSRGRLAMLSKTNIAS